MSAEGLGMEVHILQIKEVNSHYGGVHVLYQVGIEVREQEIVSTIGANGAGKSIPTRSVMRIIHLRSGDILFNGESLNHLKTDQVIKKGIVYAPEGREVFPELSVEGNLETGAFSKRYSRTKYQSLLEETYDIYPRLKDRREQLAGSPNDGGQQILTIAGGLMSGSKLTMSDKSSLGLASVIMEKVLDVIVWINKEKKLPVILVEQNTFATLSISHHCYVMENGVTKTSGRSEELMASPEAKKVYLGG